MRYASITGQEAASSMLQKLSIATLEKKHGDDRSALAALIAVVEKTAPIALTAHRWSARKFHFLQMAVAGKLWALQASFRLPDSHSCSGLLDALYYAIRTLEVDTAGPDGKSSGQMVFRTTACDRTGVSPYLGAFMFSTDQGNTLQLSTRPAHNGECG